MGSDDADESEQLVRIYLKNESMPVQEVIVRKPRVRSSYGNEKDEIDQLNYLSS